MFIICTLTINVGGYLSKDVLKLMTVKMKS